MAFSHSCSRHVRSRVKFTRSFQMDLNRHGLFLASVIFELSTLTVSLQQGLQSSFSKCGSTYTKENGTILVPTPSPSNYSTSLHCKWIIDTRNESRSHHLQLKVQEIVIEGSMPNCLTGNYVEVLIGCGYTSIGRFCGVSVLPVFYSPDGCMAIILHLRNGKSNFKAVYSLRPLNKEVQHLPNGCGISQVDNTRHGNIFSPHWPKPYPDYVDCVWTVKARKDLEVKLIFFDFDLQFHEPCKYIDFVEVRAGSTGYVHARPLTHDQECGQKKPFSMIISTDTFYITFRSYKSTGPRGFMAGFVAYEKASPAFDPQILVFFGCILLLMILIAFKKFAVPAIIRARRRLSENGLRHALNCCLPRSSCDCGYQCACQKRLSMRKRMSLRRIEDNPNQDTPNPPIKARECFVDQKECLDPSAESTPVSYQGVTDFFVTKSASDLRSGPYGEAFLSPSSNLSQTADERRLSAKSVRFASPNSSNETSQCDP